MTTPTRIPLASSTDENHTRQQTRGPVLGGMSGSPISCVGCGSPGTSRGIGLVLPSHGAYARLTAISRAASVIAQRRGCFIAGSFGVSPPCESGAAGSLSVTPEEAKRLRADGKGPSAQSRGVVSVRSKGDSAMRFPIQTASQSNGPERRLPRQSGQASFGQPHFFHSSRPLSRPVRRHWVTWPGASPGASIGEASPCRTGLLDPILDPGLPGPVSFLYFAAGFLNRSSASVGFSVRLVTLASIAGFSSTSVFSLCGYWTLPTGFQSP